MVFMCAWMKISTLYPELCMCRVCLVGTEREEEALNPGGVCDWEGNWELGLRDNVEVEEEEEKDNLEHSRGKLEEKKKGQENALENFMAEYDRTLPKEVGLFIHIFYLTREKNSMRLKPCL